jgi:hypothetical protein
VTVPRNRRRGYLAAVGVLIGTGVSMLDIGWLTWVVVLSGGAVFVGYVIQDRRSRGVA